MYSKVRVKLLGYPIHPYLVAYPIALYTVTVVAFLVYAAGGDNFWFKVAVYANVWGSLTALAAAIPGVVDWLGIPGHSRARRRGLNHMLFNGGAAVLFIINNTLYLDKVSSPHHPGATAGIIFSVLGLLLTVVGAYTGYALMQQDHVGVVPTPEEQRLAVDMT